MGTQRILAAVIAAVFGVGIYVGFFHKNPAGQETSGRLRLCTWSGYYPEEMLKDFTAKTGITVEQSFMSSNEELFAKMRAGAGGYDLVQPSDYMVTQMGRLGMLQPIDHSQIANLTHLDPFFINQSYDNGLKLSVPFAWGTTGIAVNTSKVKVPAGGISWDFLFHSPDAKHTSALDDMREVFVAALLWRNHDMNSTVASDLADARSAIQQLKGSILMFASEIRPLLLKEELTVAHAFSTDAIHAQMENPAIDYFVPKEGGTLWTDNFAIPKDAKNSAAAHTFINYFLDPQNALRIITENQLATPNKTAKSQLEPKWRDNKILYPDGETMKKLHFLNDLGETGTELMRVWTELRS